MELSNKKTPGAGVYSWEGGGGVIVVYIMT